MVVFDFGGTLDGPGIPWKERFFVLYRLEGCTVELADFAPVFHRADDTLVGTVHPRLSFHNTVLQLAERVSTGLSFDNSSATRRIAERFVEGAIACVDRNVAVLSELADRYRLGVISNFYGNLAAVCEELGLGRFLSVTVDSAVAGWMKPDPRLFRQALARLAVDAAEAVLVGDSPSRDMAGARGVGMPHILLADAASAHGEPCCPLDPVVHSLDDLRDLLL